MPGTGRKRNRWYKGLRGSRVHWYMGSWDNKIDGTGYNGRTQSMVHGGGRRTKSSRIDGTWVGGRTKSMVHGLVGEQNRWYMGWWENKIDGTWVGGRTKSMVHGLAGERNRWYMGVAGEQNRWYMGWQESKFDGTWVGGRRKSMVHGLAGQQNRWYMGWWENKIDGTWVGGRTKSMVHGLAAEQNRWYMGWRQNKIDGTWGGGQAFSMVRRFQKLMKIKFSMVRFQNVPLKIGVPRLPDQLVPLIFILPGKSIFNGTFWKCTIENLWFRGVRFNFFFQPRLEN